MKKLIALILAAVMVIGMVTVIAESSEATPAPTEEVAATESSEATPSAEGDEGTPPEEEESGESNEASFSEEEASGDSGEATPTEEPTSDESSEATPTEDVASTETVNPEATPDDSGAQGDSSDESDTLPDGDETDAGEAGEKESPSVGQLRGGTGIYHGGFTWDPADPYKKHAIETIDEMPKDGTVYDEYLLKTGTDYTLFYSHSDWVAAGAVYDLEWTGESNDGEFLTGEQYFQGHVRIDYDDGTFEEWRTPDFLVDYGSGIAVTPSPTPEVTPTPAPTPEIDFDFYGLEWNSSLSDNTQTIGTITLPRDGYISWWIIENGSGASSEEEWPKVVSDQRCLANEAVNLEWNGLYPDGHHSPGLVSYQFTLHYYYDDNPIGSLVMASFDVDYDNSAPVPDMDPQISFLGGFTWNPDDPMAEHNLAVMNIPKPGTITVEFQKKEADGYTTFNGYSEQVPGSYAYGIWWTGHSFNGELLTGQQYFRMTVSLAYDDGTSYEWTSEDFIVDYGEGPAEPEFVFNGFTWDPDKTDNTQTLATFKLPKDGTLDWGLVDVTGGAQEGEAWVVHYTGQQCAADQEVSLNWDGLNADGTHPWGKVDYLLTLQYSYADGTQGELITQEFTVDYGEAPADIPDVKFYDFTWDPEDPGRYMIVVEFTMPKAGTAYFEILRKNDDGSYTLHTATGHDHFESGQSGNWGWVGGTPLAHPVGKYTFKYRLSFEFDDGTTYSCESHDFDVDFPEIEPVFKLNGFTWDPNKENNGQTIATLTSPKDGTVSWGLGFDGGEVFGGDSDKPIYANVEYQFNWDGILPDGTRLDGVQNFVLTVTLEYADGSGTKEYTEKFSVDYDAVPVVKPTFNWTGLTWDPFKVDNTQTIATITLPKAGDVNWGIMDENCTLDSYTGWPEHVGKLVCPANTEVPLTWDGAYPDGSNPTGTVNYQLALWYHYDDGTQGSSNFISQDFSVTYPALADDLIESAAPEDTIHTSDEANWKLNEDGLYDHSKPQDFATIVLQEDGFIKWEIRLESSASASIATIAQVGSDIFASGSANLKAGEVYHAQWRGVNEQGWHPEGEAMFVVSVTVTSADGQRQQRWTDYYSMNYTHPSSQDVHTATSAPNTGTTGGSSGSSMPKTGDDAVPASVWLLLAACAFAGFMIVRKVRHG